MSDADNDFADRALDSFRQTVTWRHEGHSVMIEVMQPCGFEEGRVLTKCIAVMSLPPDVVDRIADDLKVCARRAREAQQEPRK